MDHVAILRKSWNLLPKILSGEKTIESRWYKARFAPWDKVNKGDIIYFKNSGEKVTAKAKVNKVLQFKELDEVVFNKIIDNYADEICLLETEYNEYYQSKNYCILIFLDQTSVKTIVKPFDIDKSGYGVSTAWMCVGDINDVKI